MDNKGRRVVVMGNNIMILGPGDNMYAAEHRTLKGHEKWVRSVCISSDGKRVVSGSEDRTVKVWKVEKGECIWDIPSVSHLCEEEGGAAMSVCVEFGAQIRIDTRTVHV